MKYNYLTIDFEFKSSNEKNIDLVCCAITEEGNTHAIWLHNSDSNKLKLKKYLLDRVAKNYVFIAHYASAEARALLALGFTNEEMLSIKFLDTYVLWTPLQQTTLAFGNVYSNNGEIIESEDPINRDAEDGSTYLREDGSEGIVVNPSAKRAGKGLQDILLLLLDVRGEKAYKDRMRDLILYTERYSEFDQKAILDYCKSDVMYLRDAAKILVRLLAENTKSKQIYIIEKYSELSNWMQVNAIIESNGIPLYTDKMSNLMANTDFIKDKLCKECNKVYPFFQKVKGKYVAKYSKYEEFIDSLGIEYPRSELSNKYKRDKKTLWKYEAIQELSVLGNTEHLIRTVSTLKKNKEKINGNIGKDGRIRTLMSPFSSNTARSQPRPSSGWLFGMAREIRTLYGGSRTIIECDYSGQEIALLAHISGDENLMEAYKSGDPYLWFAKKCGHVNNKVIKTKGKYYLDGEDVSKETGDTRAIFKVLMLAIGYGQGSKSTGSTISSVLFSKMGVKDKEKYSEMLLNRAAQADIDKLLSNYTLSEKDSRYYYNLYSKTFTKVMEYRDFIKKEYARKGYLKSLNEWFAFSFKRANSIPNFQIQATGSDILRIATKNAIMNGLEVVATLHDAIYIIENSSEDTELLKKIMKDACTEVIGVDVIRVDASPKSVDWDNGEASVLEDSTNFKALLEYFNNDKRPSLF